MITRHVNFLIYFNGFPTALPATGIILIADNIAFIYCLRSKLINTLAISATHQKGGIIPTTSSTN